MPYINTLNLVFVGKIFDGRLTYHKAVAEFAAILCTPISRLITSNGAILLCWSDGEHALDMQQLMLAAKSLSEHMHWTPRLH